MLYSQPTRLLLCHRGELGLQGNHLILDLPTLGVVLVFSLGLQAGALLLLHRASSGRAGLLCWANATGAIALGFLALLLRDQLGSGDLALALASALWSAAAALFYVGTLRFLGQHVHGRRILAAVVLFLVSYQVLLFVDADLQLRRALMCFTAGGFALLTSRPLFLHARPAVRAAARLLGGTFGTFGAFLLLRGALLVLHNDGSTHAVAGADVHSTPLFIGAMALFGFASFLCLGFIHLVNQDLNASQREAVENLDTIFNTSPSAVFLVRQSDGCVTSVNVPFITLTGYAAVDVVGRPARDMAVWVSAEDRDAVFGLFQANRTCDATETEWQCGDGRVLTISFVAKAIILQGEAHLLCVVDDISESRKMSRKIEQLVEELRVERDYAQANALKDDLTGLTNRRGLDEALRREFYRLKRSNRQLSVLMLDVDCFKNFNDAYGHIAGDACLRAVAGALQSSVKRLPDVVGRYGGEEFLILLADTGHDGAVLVAERVRAAVARLAIPHASSDAAPVVTVSIGTATVAADQLATAECLVELADQALYAAKSNGRNRVEAAFPVSTGQPGALIAPGPLARLVWRTAAESGNLALDGQHKQLFALANDLLAAVGEQRPKAEWSVTVALLLAAMDAHFTYEEELFVGTAYRAGTEHALGHAAAALKAGTLAAACLRDEVPLRELASLLAYEVVAQHIFMEDRQFYAHLSGQFPAAN